MRRRDSTSSAVGGMRRTYRAMSTKAVPIGSAAATSFGRGVRRPPAECLGQSGLQVVTALQMLGNSLCMLVGQSVRHSRVIQPAEQVSSLVQFVDQGAAWGNAPPQLAPPLPPSRSPSRRSGDGTPRPPRSVPKPSNRGMSRAIATTARVAPAVPAREPKARFVRSAPRAERRPRQRSSAPRRRRATRR